MRHKLELPTQRQLPTCLLYVPINYRHFLSSHVVRYYVPMIYRYLYPYAARTCLETFPREFPLGIIRQFVGLFQKGPLRVQLHDVIRRGRKSEDVESAIFLLPMIENRNNEKDQQNHKAAASYHHDYRGLRKSFIFRLADTTHIWTWKKKKSYINILQRSQTEESHAHPMS